MMPAAAVAAAAAAAEDPDERVAQCMRVLEGATDEHKFAGLLMVAKLNDLSPERLAQVRRQVLATVGRDFFLRLLHTKGSDQAEGLSSFQTLGLNLIASFCCDSEVADEFAQDNLVRFLVEQLGASGCPRDSLEDCVRALNGLVASEKGNKTFLHEAVIGRLFGALKTLSRGQPVAKAEETKSEDASGADGTTLEAKAWAVVGQLSTNPSFWKRVHNYDFDFMCSRFGKVGGAASLRILSILNDYMRLVEANEAPAELLTSQCLSDIRSGVLHFLRSKWPHQERDECLRLVYQLMQQAGTSWMVPGTTLRSQAPPEEVSGGKFVLFLLKLVSIEIKLILDEVELALVQMEEAKIEEAGEAKRRGREIERGLQVLPVCYGVVEQVISGLVSSDVDSLVLPYEALLQMKNTFADTFVVVLEFMNLASEYTQTHRYRGLKEAQDPSVFKLDAVICASVRVIGAWIAEDSDTSVDVVLKVLPFMICYTPLSTTAGVGEAEGTGGNQDEVDSDDELDSDDEVDALAGMIKSVSGTDGQDHSVDQLHFLLPGLLQISALPEGAAALSEDGEVLRRLMGFTCTLCAEIADGASEFGGISTMTLCLGVLINLILVRGGDGTEASSAGLPNAVEWFRSLAFLLPVACASGSRLVNDSELTMEARGEDDRYVMLLHVVCVVLFIASHFQDRDRHPTRLPESATRLVAPFNTIVGWILSHPPAVDAESTLDLFELVRVLSMRSLLTPQLLSR